MKVALLAFSVRGAMGQYLEALVPPLSQHLDLSLYVPEHFEETSPLRSSASLPGHPEPKPLGGF